MIILSVSFSFVYYARAVYESVSWLMMICLVCCETVTVSSLMVMTIIGKTGFVYGQFLGSTFVSFLFWEDSCACTS